MWTATLSNNEVIKEDSKDMHAWRKLAEYCHKKDLNIKKLEHCNMNVDTNAIGYYIFYEALVLGILTPKNTKTIFKKGIGAIRLDDNGNKIARISWFEPIPPFKRLYNEVARHLDSQLLEEVAIYKDDKARK